MAGRFTLTTRDGIPESAVLFQVYPQETICRRLDLECACAAANGTDTIDRVRLTKFRVAPSADGIRFKIIEQWYLTSRKRV